MNKKISFKLWLTVLFEGICQFLQKIAGLFGYKEGTTFGKVIWRIFVSCFTALFLIGTVIFVYAFMYEVVYREWIRPHTVEIVYSDKHLSNHIVFQELYYQDKGRIYDEILKKVVVEEVDWVVVSDDKDSLAVFAKNGKRGYLNRFTGEVSIMQRPNWIIMKTKMNIHQIQSYTMWLNVKNIWCAVGIIMNTMV